MATEAKCSVAARLSCGHRPRLWLVPMSEAGQRPLVSPLDAALVPVIAWT
jgi:hypothetical protein